MALYLTAVILGLVQNPVKNGFVLSDPLVPVNEILSGGPPRDGIPAINNPQFISASETTLAGDAKVIGVRSGEETKAYPIKILNWHEVVNDKINGVAIVITYCPLCGSGVVFRSEVNGKNLTFGVSGLLYNSDVLLYDRENESLWSQLRSGAVTGPLSGTALEMFPSQMVTWNQWRSRYPNTLVLTEETGFARDYARDPYIGYAQTEDIYFPISNFSNKLHSKEIVLGVEINGNYKAYPVSDLKGKNGTITDKFQGTDLTIAFDKTAGTAWMQSPQNVNSTLLFWFAWYAFHPDTEVYKK